MASVTLVSKSYPSLTIQQNNPVITITKAGVATVALQVPGPQGPSGMSVVSHGTNGATARPAGVPVVYWIGTVKPTNALPYDLWYNG